MRVLVDEIPGSDCDCIFRGWALHRECLFGDGECKLYDSNEECPYLKLADTPIKMELT